MSLESDLNLSKEKFSDDAIPRASVEFNDQLIKEMTVLPKWHEVLPHFFVDKVETVAVVC
jgi:hypothetical protein